jgi:uncharacterized UPF0146 family protein
MRRPGHEGRARIVRHGVLVDGDVGGAKRGFRVLAGDIAADQVDQEQVVLRAARDDLVAAPMKVFAIACAFSTTWCW